MFLVGFWGLFGGLLGSFSGLGLGDVIGKSLTMFLVGFWGLLGSFWGLVLGDVVGKSLTMFLVGFWGLLGVFWGHFRVWVWGML